MTRKLEQLSRTFVELADTLVGDFDVVEFLHLVAIRCVEIVEVDAAGILLVDQHGALRVAGSSTEQVRLLELFEVQNRQGPCLDCVRTGERVVEERLAQSSRWPRFGPEAVAAGFNSVEAVPMRLRSELIGALNLFRTEPRALDESEASICRALADVATIALLQVRAVSDAQGLAQQLHTALNSRVTIEQAKGVLAERGHLAMDAAFDLMRAFARSNNRRLVTVAEAVISGELALADLLPRR